MVRWGDRDWFGERRTWGILLIVVVIGAGCSHEPVAVPTTNVVIPIHPSDPGTQVVIPGQRAWVDTNFDVEAGQPITLVAEGQIQFREPKFRDRNHAVHTGPAGTYLYRDNAAYQQFPLPSAADGPAPCYCLIGRIGDGPPFFVGQAKSFRAKTSGRLQLGINDFDLIDNAGEFRVTISLPNEPQPMSLQTIVADASGQPAGNPAENSRVVVFYVDGLRPDVVREMAAMGHLPHIRDLFLDGGSWLGNTFTAFPSDTITSNGTMWTGCFSDRHGLKGQVRFSRRTLQSESYLETLGPNRSARLLSPQRLDKSIHDTTAQAVGLVHGQEAKTEFAMSNATGVPPLFARLRNQGSDWATGALPMMTDLPPVLWSRSLVHEMPLLQMHEAWKYIDDANTHYAKWHLLDEDKPVTIIWLPETDSVSHKRSRGQFGLTRRTIARADQLIGEVIAQIRSQGRFEQTYFLLVSDHGHHGGRETHLSQFDLANQFFFHPRELSADGKWLGGGLGLSVRQHRRCNKHPEDTGREFVFLDGHSDGAARIFLPRNHYRSQDWQAPYSPGPILAYPIAPHLPPVNLVDSLLQVSAVHGSGHEEQPVDLVLLRLDDSSILISTADRGQAVIERERQADGDWWYRYSVVSNVEPTPDGNVEFKKVINPKSDPLGLLAWYSPQQLAGFYDERTWLKMTTPTRYPDSVVALTRHLLWQDNLTYREREFAPDLVVTARPGWYFGQEATKGTTHGYPFEDAMRATLFVAGPNVRRGCRIEEPARLADLTPTILQMTGTPYDPDEMDGTALHSFYESDSPAQIDPPQGVFWEELDLKAWSRLPYGERETYPFLPPTVHQPDSPWDLNNLSFNAISVLDWNVWRLADMAVDPFSQESRAVSGWVDRWFRFGQDAAPHSVSHAVGVADVPGLAVSDYNFTSTGNLKRADRAVDWLQDRQWELAGNTGLQSLPGQRLMHGMVDATQTTFWEAYRFAQRLLIQVLDETVLNSVENGIDRTLHRFHQLPAEIIVDEQP